MLLIDVIHAEQDPDLRMRFVAAAALAGEKDPSTWQYEHRYQLVAAPIAPGSDDTISSVWVYARDGAKVDRPGLDPTIVTDDYVKAAVAHVQDATRAGA